LSKRFTGKKSQKIQLSEEKNKEPFFLNQSFFDYILKKFFLLHFEKSSKEIDFLKLCEKNFSKLKADFLVSETKILFNKENIFIFSLRKFSSLLVKFFSSSFFEVFQILIEKKKNKK